MMISPESYIEKLQDNSYEELLKVRDRLIRKVRHFEKHKAEIMNQELVIHPSPDVVYQWNLEALGMLFKLLQEKFNEEYEG